MTARRIFVTGAGLDYRQSMRSYLSVSRARSKVIIVGNPVTLTTFSNDAEEEAKRHYRRLFAVIEELATRGLSRIFNSESI